MTIPEQRSTSGSASDIPHLIVVEEEEVVIEYHFEDWLAIIIF